MSRFGTCKTFPRYKSGRWITKSSASVSLKHKKFVAGGPDMWVHLHDMETKAEEQTNKGHHRTRAHGLRLKLRIKIRTVPVPRTVRFESGKPLSVNERC